MDFNQTQLTVQIIKWRILKPTKHIILFTKTSQKKIIFHSFPFSQTYYQSNLGTKTSTAYDGFKVKLLYNDNMLRTKKERRLPGSNPICLQADLAANRNDFITDHARQPTYCFTYPFMAKPLHSPTQFLNHYKTNWFSKETEILSS